MLRFRVFINSSYILSGPCITQGPALFLRSLLVNLNILPEVQGFQCYILSRLTEITAGLLSVWHGPLQNHELDFSTAILKCLLSTVIDSGLSNLDFA